VIRDPWFRNPVWNLVPKKLTHAYCAKCVPSKNAILEHTDRDP